MRATQPASDNGLSFDRSLLLKKNYYYHYYYCCSFLPRFRILAYYYYYYYYCVASKSKRVSCIEIFPIKKSTSFELEKKKGRETYGYG